MEIFSGRSGIRPEHIRYGAKGKLQIAGQTDLIERLGEIGYAHVALPKDQTIVAQVNGEPNVDRGEAVTLTMPPQHIHFFVEDGAAVPFAAT